MTTWRVPIACRIPKATDTHREYLILVAIHCNNGYKYATEYYLLRTWPVFLIGYKCELREFFVLFRQKMR